MTRSVTWVLGFCLAGCQIPKAEADSLYRNAQALAMGSTGVALVEDESAVFLNPAGLAGIKNPLFRVSDLHLEASQDVIVGIRDFKNQWESIQGFNVDPILGKDFYARAQATSIFAHPFVGIAAIADAQGALSLQNQAAPFGHFEEQLTYGFQGAFGIPIFKFSKKKGEIRWGMGLKVLWRSSGQAKPSVKDILTVNAKSLSGLTPFGRGIGVDTGIQWVYRPEKKWTLYGGAVVQDIGETSFTSHAIPEAAQLNLGFAATYSIQHRASVTAAFEVSQVLEALDWRKKLHFGAKVRYSVLNFYGGINHMLLTGGIGVNLGLLSFAVVSYADEMTALVGQNSRRVSLFRLALDFNL